LKWSPPGKTARTEGDQFGFALGERRPRDVYAKAFAAAEILGARNLRVFSYLAYDGYCVDDLREPVEDLLALAEKFDMKVHVENEGVCNIAGLAELETMMTKYRHPRLRALPDIANAYRMSVPPSAADLARLLPFTDILHIKDYSNAARGFVAVGEGDIPIATLLAATLPTREAPLTLTIETHASSEPVATTRRSVSGCAAWSMVSGSPDVPRFSVYGPIASNLEAFAGSLPTILRHVLRRSRRAIKSLLKSSARSRGAWDISRPGFGQPHRREAQGFPPCG
jgi:hypothetical protein